MTRTSKGRLVTSRHVQRIASQRVSREATATAPSRNVNASKAGPVRLLTLGVILQALESVVGKEIMHHLISILLIFLNNFL